MSDLPPEAVEAASEAVRRERRFAKRLDGATDAELANAALSAALPHLLPVLSAGATLARIVDEARAQALEDAAGLAREFTTAESVASALEDAAARQRGEDR